MNDLDGSIVNFFRVVRDQPEELARVCRLTPYARDEYVAALDDPSLDDLERARRLWVRIVQSFQHTAETPRRTGWSFTTNGSKRKGRTGQNLVEKFEVLSRRLAEVLVENVDALILLEKVEDDDALIYADPPYLATTRTAGTQYAVEADTEAFHRDLAAVLRARPCPVAVSGYHSPLYDELFAGWYVTEYEVFSSAGSPVKRVEVLWTNYDPDARARETRLF